MAKRKFGASIIILCIAAVTLISGTYAWFLVGGFAELFDIGFDVMKATGGILVQGDKNSAEKGAEVWGSFLDQVDFQPYSFIDGENNGRYYPISSMDGKNFVYVTMQNNKFICDPVPVKTKADGTITDSKEVWFNDFTLFIKSSDEYTTRANMTIELSGHRYDENTGEKIDDIGAAKAAKVAVTIDDGTPTMYSLDGKTTYAVTSKFADGVITDALDTSQTPPAQNYIIDEADSGYGEAHLEKVESIALGTEDAQDPNKWNPIPIDLGEIPNNASSGKKIRVQIWLEGNDPECISFGTGAIANKGLKAKVSFASK
jgi:ACT domain-containing protein